ncbi:YjfB family protein [Hydrogenovibrio halophilus]|uniref:YjfB family protein n=1 Tax=Hydrogenovibrio halophilus TaxID=373391 RepID=UPI00036F2F7B|nr:YjfB family protein [Hydrogenovibrio halophilus]
MDISNVSAGAIAGHLMRQDQANTHQQVQVSMLKKAMDSQAEGAMTLLESVPGASSAGGSSQALPANLGNHINTTA